MKSNNNQRVTLHIKIKPDWLLSLRTQAKQERRRMCDVLEEALRQYIFDHVEADIQEELNLVDFVEGT